MNTHPPKNLIVLRPGALACERIYVGPGSLRSDQESQKISLRRFIQQVIKSAANHRSSLITIPAFGCDDDVSICSILESVHYQLLCQPVPLAVKIIVPPENHHLFNTFREEICKLRTGDHDLPRAISTAFCSIFSCYGADSLSSTSKLGPTPRQPSEIHCSDRQS